MLTFHGQVMSSNLGLQGDFLIARGTPGARKGSFLPHFEAGDVEIGICPTELIKVNIFIQSLLLTHENLMKISWKSHENPRFPLKSGRFVFLRFASLTARQARPRSVTEAATGGRVTGWGGFVISRGAGAQWPWLLGKPVTAVELVFQVSGDCWETQFEIEATSPDVGPQTEGVSMSWCKSNMLGDGLENPASNRQLHELH